MSYIHEHARPFYYKGNNIGCLLIHGFTGCPAEMRLLGDYLRDIGYTVKGIKLEGHGTSIADMEYSTWKDWMYSAERSLIDLQNKCDKVFLIGLSMGAMIALNLGSMYDVKGVISLSAPIKITNKKVYFSSVLKFFTKYIEKQNKEIDSEIAEYCIGYDMTPVSSIPHLLKLIRMAKRRLKKITCPALIIQSKNDNTVRYESAEILHKRIGSSFKKLVYLKKSSHVITLGCERDRVFKEISNFVEQFKNQQE